MKEELISRPVFEKTLKKILLWGMFLNLGVPTGLLVTAYFLTGASAILHVTPGRLDLIFLIFLAASLSDLGVAAWMRFFLLSSERLTLRARLKNVLVSSVLFNTTVAIYTLCLVSAVLGFGYFVLGGQVEKGLLLLVFNLLGYQFLRPRPELVKKLLGYSGG